jgi:nucleoside-diphosphate-sugar epimerase
VVVELIDRQDGPEVLNVGSGHGTTLAELLEIVENELGHRAQVETLADRGFEVDRIVLDTSRLRQLTNFEPLPLETGVARTHTWLTKASAQPA